MLADPRCLFVLYTDGSRQANANLGRRRVLRSDADLIVVVRSIRSCAAWIPGLTEGAIGCHAGPRQGAKWDRYRRGHQGRVGEIVAFAIPPPLMRLRLV